MRHLVRLWILFDLVSCARVASAGEPPAAYQVDPPVAWRAFECFNCPACGKDCTCAGGGYYCDGTFGPCDPTHPLRGPLVRRKVPPPVPPGFEGFEWRPDPRGPDGWGLFQKSIPKSGVVPGPTLPPAPPRHSTPWVVVPPSCPNGRCPLQR